MTSNGLKQRLYASLLMFGSSILLFRAQLMLLSGALDVNVLWVSVLLVAEFLVDLSCFISCIIWWIKNDESKASVPLRFGAAAVILHAVRVLIFVLGRTGPWINFDVKPVHRAFHATRWTWAQVYFAAIMSILGVMGVIIIWRLRRRAKKSTFNTQHGTSNIQGKDQ